MSKKVFTFVVPIKGQEMFSVIAENYEEAIDKINKEDYYLEPELDDINWDFGFRGSDEELPNCYTVEDFEGE